jgi:hypothetical protein
MSNNAWYNQPQFEDFWKHYHRSCLWLQMNGVQPIHFFKENSLFIDNQVNNLDKENLEYNDDENGDEHQIDDDDDDDDEIDPDYINFIRETRRHQKERGKDN